MTSSQIRRFGAGAASQVPQGADAFTPSETDHWAAVAFFNTIPGLGRDARRVGVALVMRERMGQLGLSRPKIPMLARLTDGRAMDAFLDLRSRGFVDMGDQGQVVLNWGALR